MRRARLNQSGFGLILEIVLAAVVLLVIATVFLRFNPITKRTDGPVPTPSPPKIKTYTSQYEGATLQYPSTWRTVEQAYPQDGPTANSLTLLSPSGINLYFETPMPDGGGGCVEDCRFVAQKVESMSTLALDMVQEQLTVGGQTVQVIGAMSTDDAGKLVIGTSVPYSDLNYFTFPSRQHTGRFILLMTGHITPEQAQSADFEQAKQIIQSLHYQ